MKFQIITRVTIFLIVLLLVSSYFSAVFSPKWEGINDNPSRTFYNLPKDSIDVLFLGASSLRKGMSPLVFWEEYGFTSYNRSTATQAPAVTYYYLVESLKYQHPKVVILDGVSLFKDYDVDNSEARLRQCIDPMKFSVEKLQLIFDVVYKSKKQDISSFLFPLLRYHSRWNEITQADFEYFKRDGYDPFKGQFVMYNILPSELPKNFMKPTNEAAKYNEDSLNYFEKAIQLCKKNDIQVVFLTLPRLAYRWNYSKYLATKQLAEKYDLSFIDYSLPNDTGAFEFDPLTDFSDPGHLNVYGAQKFSNLFGAYLQEKYAFSDKRNDLKYEQWNMDLQYFKNQLARKKTKFLGNN